MPFIVLIRTLLLLIEAQVSIRVRVLQHLRLQLDLLLESGSGR